MFGLVGIAGSLAGSALNRRLDGGVLPLAFAGLILVAAWRIVVGCPSCTRSGEASAIEQGHVSEGAVKTRPCAMTPGRVVKIVAAGTAVGFLTGLFGVGGGFVIVPALALVLEFPMGIAIGTSLLVIAVNSAVALAPGPAPARSTGARPWCSPPLRLPVSGRASAWPTASNPSRCNAPSPSCSSPSPSIPAPAPCLPSTDREPTGGPTLMDFTRRIELDTTDDDTIAA